MKNKLILALYFFITLGPLLMGLGYSLLYSLGLIGLLNDGFTLKHWIRLWNSNDALGSLWYSSWLTIISLVLTLFLALWTAWFFIKNKSRGSYSVLFLPLLFPPLIAAFAWYYLLSPSGLISRFFYQIGLINGIDGFPRMVNDNFSVGILVTHVFLVFPLFTLLFIEQAKKERMAELLSSSLTLGSNYMQFIRRVYIPLLVEKTQSVIWLYGIFLLGTYEVPLLLGQSSPRTVTIFITENMRRYNLEDISVGHAMAVIYSLFVLLIISVFVRKKAISLF
ncbi:MAG: hypothetical protein AAFO07_01165 [Bacteroidota bacterium]